MSNDWFRSWHNAPLDVKWLGVARKAGVPVGTVVSIVWACLDRASQAQQRGSIDGMDVNALADFFGYDPEDVERVIAALHERKILANDAFAKWDVRQPKRERYDEDTTATERKQASRARKGPKTDGGGGVTPDIEPCHAKSHHVTPPDAMPRPEEIRQDIPSPVGDGRPAAADPQPRLLRPDTEPPRPELRVVDGEVIGPDDDAEKRLFDSGKRLLGKSAGGQIAKLLKAHRGDVAAAQQRIDRAARAENPAEFVAGCIVAATSPPKATRSSHDRDAISRVREELARAGYC